MMSMKATKSKYETMMDELESQGKVTGIEDTFSSSIIDKLNAIAENTRREYIRKNFLSQQLAKTIILDY